LLATGEAEEGIGCYQRALIADPKNRSAHEALAEYFHRNGQLHRALEHRRAAGGDSIRSGPELAEAMKESGKESTHASDFQAVVGPTEVVEATAEEVHQLCAACHAYPPPESFPKSAWRKEVQLGYDFLWDSSLSGKFPSLESVVRYYENRAPNHLEPTAVRTATAAHKFNFEVAGAGWLANTQPFPATTHLSFVRLKPKKNLDLVVCDAPVLVPSHAEAVDLDGDGNKDLIAASLGQFFPTDDKVGSVVWLRAAAGGSYSPVTLLDGVGRVADVRPADFNSDGLIDLVVAVFGWRKGGEILYLENKTTDWAKPVFVTHKIDNRHGASHVPVADLNKDGLPDFVALISQEHETVVAFLNEGNGQFRKEQIFAAPHPAYGCSGIELVDVDGDRDLDVLLTNGDVLDRPYILKPYHGVQWLENTGAYPFQHHSIGAMHGASRAVAADMDGDHDIDVVAVSFLPAQEFPAREQQRIPSAMLFEQTSPGNFVAHVLEAGSCDHFSCAVADWNIDGRVDFALGNFSWKRSHAIPDAALLLKSVAD
jgi:cytochrome c5